MKDDEDRSINVIELPFDLYTFLINKLSYLN